MNTDYRTDSPEILLDFLSYHETIKAHSQRTVDEYYLDLRNFFRYLKWSRDPALQEQPMDAVDIRDVDLPFVGAVTLSEVYGLYGLPEPGPGAASQQRPVRQGAQPRVPGPKAGDDTVVLWVFMQQSAQAGSQSREGYRCTQAEKNAATVSDPG